MRRKRILVVEDDTDLRKLFKGTLALAGYDVYEASDGMDALHAIDIDPPDLVLLDLKLRVIDGLAVQQELAARAITRSIPIVIVTGSDAEIAGDNVACVLRKPVTADRLIQTVRQCTGSGAAAPGL